MNRVDVNGRDYKAGLAFGLFMAAELHQKSAAAALKEGDKKKASAHAEWSMRILRLQIERRNPVLKWHRFIYKALDWLTTYPAADADFEARSYSGM